MPKLTLDFSYYYNSLSTKAKNCARMVKYSHAVLSHSYLFKHSSASYNLTKKNFCYITKTSDMLLIEYPTIFLGRNIWHITGTDSAFKHSLHILEKVEVRAMLEVYC